MKGRVFEIREFCLHDGPGPRTTVFLQGCPLRCTWCQNPEGQENRIGEEVAAEDVAKEILKTVDFLVGSGGGVTFSGGEPLGQPDFVLEIISRIRGSASGVSSLSFVLETSGFAPESDYRRVTEAMDLVLQDVKFPDAEGYRKWAGVDATVIFRNLDWLKRSGIPFVARIPMIPGVNDSRESKGAMAELLVGARGLRRVELLPYNRLAGAKYAKLGRIYSPGFDESVVPDLDMSPFERLGVECIAMRGAVSRESHS